MTRLVVHVGTSHTNWHQVQRQLVSWRSDLERQGIWLHPADKPGRWQTDTAAWLDAEAPPMLGETLTSAATAGADIVVLSSDRLHDVLRDPAHVTALGERARNLAMAVTVVVVVRDQLGYLNETYCDRVTRLAMARDFDAFTTDPTPAERFDYGTAFAALIEAEHLELVAVPFSAVDVARPAEAVLVAAGVSPAAVRDLPSADAADSLPGPVLVAACRLLFKRLFRLGLLGSLSRPRLARTMARLRTQADERGWDDTAFWGWTPSARATAIARYAPGNDSFAQAVWGRPWGDDWSDGVHMDVDLPSTDPALVVDVLDAVDLIVQELQETRAALGID